MITVHTVIVILALICLLAAACEVQKPRFNLLAAGLFLWLLSTLITSGAVR